MRCVLVITTCVLELMRFAQTSDFEKCEPIQILIEAEQQARLVVNGLSVLRQMGQR